MSPENNFQHKQIPFGVAALDPVKKNHAWEEVTLSISHSHRTLQPPPYAASEDPQVPQK